MEPRTRLYRTIWRWHFYAGLFVMPFVLLLSVTGAIYLFKPQIDLWEEQAFRDLPAVHPVSADQQVATALARYPGATLDSYRLPVREHDAALVSVTRRDAALRDVFVSPEGHVVGDLDPQWRITNIVFKLHGELLMGNRGAWLVELAGNWALVMILTGLYLWWPAGCGAAGVVWPRLRLGRRAFWRDLHSVTGFWVSGFALVLLVTALPWTGVWGSAFAAARAQLGLVKGVGDWTVGGQSPVADEHDGHHPVGRAGGARRANMATVPISIIIARAARLDLPSPVLIRPPGAVDGSAPDTGKVWTVKSETQNRPLRITITFDAATGRERQRTAFADQHPVDRAVGYGIAWHEGQLFGWPNQLIGLVTAIALLVMTVSGFVMWRRRKPANMLGAPPMLRHPARMGGVVVILLGLAIMLPLLALSLIGIFALEHTLLRYWTGARLWLGLPSS